MTLPLVTAVVDTYNHEAFIEQALDSVFMQGLTPNDLEILVVDDGSTDRTSDVLKKFAPRVRVLRKENGGQASAFNDAIPLARGEILAFLDGDDWWAKDKLQSVLKVFHSDPSIGVVGHGFDEVDEMSGHLLRVTPSRLQHVSLRTVEDGAGFRSVMTFFGTSRVAIRREVLDLVGRIPDALVIEADEFMSTMAVANSEAVLLQEPLTSYRIHGGNLYQFRDGDLSKIRRKMTVLVELGLALRRELGAFRTENDIISAIVEPIDVEAKQLKLMCFGGTSWETFQVERATARLAYKHMPWKYQLFKRFVLALTLLLPPKIFYKLRHQYTKMNLRRLRRFTGEPVPAALVDSSKDKTDVRYL
jgi:glycosyltransferase involved in cell wall biosynthesis